MSETTQASLAKTNELVVHVIAKPSPKTKWLKDNKELIIKDRYKVESKQIGDDENFREYKLIIDNVQPNDNGKYKIEVSNKCASESNQTDMIVRGEPAFVRKPSNASFVEKKAGRLECEVIGIPIPTVEWY